MYPKTLFLEKQQQEKVRLEKEKVKILEKFQKADSSLREPPENPTTFRE